ncbi:hypothetical protein ACH4TX_42045 [Streptomyces sp. NPDC021098]|uniref:hypothetical protein n=1 Tax=unclassified Streptomyces TaxID=2593676 RepID=UPI0037B3DAF3
MRGVLLVFPVAVLVLAVWAWLEHVWQESRARRIAHRPVMTAEHLVHDRYEVLADLYDAPPRGPGRG